MNQQVSESEPYVLFRVLSMEREGDLFIINVVTKEGPVVFRFRKAVHLGLPYIDNQNPHAEELLQFRYAWAIRPFMMAVWDLIDGKEVEFPIDIKET